MSSEARPAGPYSGRWFGRFGRGRLLGRWASSAICLLLLSFSFGCDAQHQKTKLLLYCGAGIRPPVEEIAETFGRRYGVTVECDYAGSEVLLSRIKLSGSGDVYIPGDVHYVNQAKNEGLIATSETVCYFVPVILVEKGNPKNIQLLADLFRPGIKIGLGDPEACAIGRKSSTILRKNNISEQDLAGNVKFRSLTVNELGDKVKLGALDAVIVWDAVAAYYADSTEVVRIPSDQNIVSTVAAAVLNSSVQAELAHKLLDFIASGEGKAIFKKHHYSLTVPE